MMLKPVVLPLVWLFFLLFPLQVLAWHSTGHQVIATLAAQQLNSKAQTQVEALLALEPGSTLASISTWADEQRSKATASWHYVNFLRGSCVYVKERDCLDGNCLIGAIEQQTAVLKSGAPDLDKLQALKYLVHLVGDSHQPLHAGYAHDRGGNQYQVELHKRGTNLHAVWDSGLIQSVSDNPEVWVGILKTKRVTSNAEVIDPVMIAKESCRIVARSDFYPGRQVDSKYVEAYRPIIEQQLSLAGARLARMLNRIWP